MSQEFKANRIIDRAKQLQKVRTFFENRCVLEVDTPILVEYPNLDTHIELFQATDGSHPRYLHTSPEFGMKRLLALLQKDIYQLSHVFRAKELGKKHNPEFTMIEWYRIGKSFDDLIAETLELIFLFIPPCPIRTVSYFDLFYEQTKIALLEENEDKITNFLKDRIDLPSNLHFYEKIDLLFGLFIEPNLKNITIIKGFPHWQKALAKLETINGISSARRFEIYFQQVELANGYDELLDPLEQRRRFQEVLDERIQLKKSSYKIDDRFISCLASLPECVGVAVGFDRLMMVRHHAQSIEEILSFGFEEI
jgi:lysyl-tRNA synthetase class 2